MTHGGTGVLGPGHTPVQDRGPGVGGAARPATRTDGSPSCSLAGAGDQYAVLELGAGPMGARPHRPIAATEGHYDYQPFCAVRAYKID